MKCIGQQQSRRTAKGAVIGVAEGETAQELANGFIGSCRPSEFSIGFDNETTVRVVKADVPPLLIFIVDRQQIQVGFDMLKWSGMSGGWEAVVTVERSTIEAISNGRSFSVEIVDNARDRKILGKIDTPAAGLQKAFAAFLKACF